MVFIWPNIVIVLCSTSLSVKANPLTPPLVSACETLIKNSAQCQITYSGWQQLNRCLQGASVFVPDIEQSITCACSSHQPRAVSAGSAHVSTSPTSSLILKGTPEQDDTFPTKQKIKSSPEVSLPSPQNSLSSAQQRGSSLADFDYVAPDGSVAMASRAPPPGVAGLAVVVLAVIVAVLLGVVGVLCWSRHCAAAVLEEVEEEEQGEEDGGGEGGETEGPRGGDEKNSQVVKERDDEEEEKKFGMKKEKEESADGGKQTSTKKEGNDYHQASRDGDRSESKEGEKEEGSRRLDKSERHKHNEAEEEQESRHHHQPDVRDSSAD